MKRGAYHSLQNLGAVPVAAMPGPASARQAPPKRKPGAADLLAAMRRGARRGKP